MFVEKLRCEIEEERIVIIAWVDAVEGCGASWCSFVLSA